MGETKREMATRHVLSGRRIVAGQRTRIEQMRSGGRDTPEAERLLSLYERTQTIFEDDLKRLTREQ